MYDINTRFRLVRGLETNKWCFIKFRCQPSWAGGGLLDNARVSNYKNYRVLDKDIHPRYTPLLWWVSLWVGITVDGDSLWWVSLWVSDTEWVSLGAIVVRSVFTRSLYHPFEVIRYVSQYTGNNMIHINDTFCLISDPKPWYICWFLGILEILTPNTVKFPNFRTKIYRLKYRSTKNEWCNIYMYIV